MSDLGKFIAEHREVKKLSRRKLAELANISHTEIHRLENGERKTPSPVIAASIPGTEDLTDDEIEEVRNFIDFLRAKRK